MSSTAYEWLSAREHALHRPDTYAGSIVPTEHAQHVFDVVDGATRRRDVVVHVAPALLKVSDEVIVNAIDNHTRDEAQKNIKLTFDPSGTFSVSNDGSTIPIEHWKGTSRYIPEILFGEMMSGENFNDDTKRVVGGRNGLGVKIAAILAEWFEVSIVNTADNLLFHDVHDDKAKLLSKRVENQQDALALFQASKETVTTPTKVAFLNVVDAKGRCDKRTLVLHRNVVYHNYGPLCYDQRFEHNLSTTHPPTVTRALAKDRISSTTIRWKVDLPRLNMASPLSEDVIALLSARAYDAAACTHQRVAVTLNGGKIPCKTIKDYAAALGGVWIGRDVCEGEVAGPCLDVCILRATEDAPAVCVGFVNGIRCSCGTHVDMVYKKIGEALSEIVGKKTKRAVNLQPAQLAKLLTAVVGATIINPVFSSQTKERLAMRSDKLGVSYACSPSTMRALERSGVVQALCDAVTAQDERAVSKSVKTDRARVGAIHKYERALKLYSKQPCSLYITEGDSAKALAVAGFSVIGRDFNGVFPLKGKLINVNGMPAKKALENKEVKHLTQILGLDPTVVYTAEKVLSLPYRRLVIFTDQDHDGSHITGLILNWLQTYYPSLLLAAPDFVSRFATPIIRARVSGETRAFFSLVEYREWLAGRTPAAVKYFKGLGTSDTEDAKRYFSNIEDHLIVVCHTGVPCSDAIQTFFHASKTHERKEILRTVDPDSFIDYSKPRTTWTQFLFDEMIHFGTADNVRSLSNAIDGLKPSQRKVLYTALHRKSGETRVSQFASAVAESTCYHHGEASLVQTIVNMAQPWMGTNNVALLKPLGMFGARHMPRTEHSAERYIFTEKHEIARLIFRTEDDPILTLGQDDGKNIEPVLFHPIIPYLLINGADGIGMGWRCFVSAHDPLAIVERTRLLIDDPNAALCAMTPYFEGFKGTTSKKNDDEFIFTGIYAVESDAAVRITELPPKVWTTPYVEWVREHLVGDGPNCFVVDIIDSSTHDDVNLLIKTKPTADLRNRDLVKDLKLAITVDTKQLNFFDADAKLHHHVDVAEIMRNHALHRRAAYVKRVAAQISALSHEYLIATNKSRFVKAVCDKTLEPHTMTSDELRDRLHHEQYYDFKNFKYLESLGIFSITRDLSDNLRHQADVLQQELDKLKRTRPEAIWHKELDELEVGLRAYKEALEAKRMDIVAPNPKKRKNASSSSSKPKKPTTVSQ